jgi:hypothetical protein
LLLSFPISAFSPKSDIILSNQIRLYFLLVISQWLLM